MWLQLRKKSVLEQYPQLEKIEDKQERFKEYIDILSQTYIDNKDIYWDKSEKVNDFSEEIQQKFLKKKFATSCCKQYRLLFLRKTLVNRRGITTIILKICQGLICGLFVCALYFTISRNSTGIMDRQGMMCVGVILAALTNMLCNILACKYYTYF
jgi:hypothetical protein